MAKYPMQFNDQDVKSGNINVGPDGCLQPSNYRQVKYTGAMKVNIPVRINSDGTVAPASKGNNIVGVCVKILSETECLIALRGSVVTLPYTGTAAPSLGYNYLVADGDGGVKLADSSACNSLVWSKDEENKTITCTL